MNKKTTLTRKVVAMVSMVTYFVGSTVFGALPVGVAASDVENQTVNFNYKVIMELTLSNPTVSFGDVYAYEGETVTAPGGNITVKTNRAWDLTIESLGRDGAEGGDNDAVFATPGNANTISVNKLKVVSGLSSGFDHNLTGGPLPVLTGKPRTAAAGLTGSLTYSLSLDGTEDIADGYQTVIRYTAINS